MDNKRLVWGCRRGMLELDLMLRQFLDEAYPALAEADQLCFQNLLTCEDQDLFGWLLGRQESPADFQRITALIRKQCDRPR